MLVPLREFISVSPNGRIAVVFGADRGIEIIDVRMIQSIEAMPDKQQRGGKRTRRKAG